MKIVVIGGTGLIGSKVVDKLKQRGQHAVAAAPSTSVDAVTGEGLAEALSGAQVVVDVANSPSFEGQAAMDFFQTAGKNLTAAEEGAGVGHHVALSVVGTDRMQKSGYFRAKLAQERLIKRSPIAYTLIHATQFFWIRAPSSSIRMRPISASRSTTRRSCPAPTRAWARPDSTGGSLTCRHHDRPGHDAVDSAPGIAWAQYADLLLGPASKRSYLAVLSSTGEAHDCGSADELLATSEQCAALAEAVRRVRDPVPQRWAQHPKFGRVRVVDETGEGAHRKLTVELANGARKTLLARFLTES